MTQNEINDYLFARNKIRRVSYRYQLLNSNDAPIGELSINNAQISHNIFRELKGLASFEFDEYHQREINFLTERIKPFFVLKTSTEVIEWPLGVFLLSSPNQIITGRQKTRTIAAFDKILILKDDKLSEPLFFSKGTLYTDALRQILQDTGIGQYRLTPSMIALNTDREFTIGISILEVVNTLLGEINYASIYVDATGWFVLEPYVLPEDRPIDHKYISTKTQIILPSMENELDLLDRANVFVAYSVNTDTNTIMEYKVTNDNPASLLSTVTRGREIVKVIEVQNAPTIAVLEATARQMMTEESTAYNHIVFGTATLPTHGHGQNLYLDIPDLSNVPIVSNETAWEINTSGTMRHEARRLIRL